MTRNSKHESENRGFDPAVIEEYRNKMKKLNQNYIMIDSADNSDEFKNFYFIGVYEGKEVIYDAVIYTLRLHHNSELYEVAEGRAAKRFPEYKIHESADDEENPEDLDEEVGLFMTEVMQELEEEGEVRVNEHLELDPHVDFGIGMNVALNVEKITPAVIDKFVTEYNDHTFQLDDTMYTFQLEDE